jgi:outer membrane protein OmpA-like peptidoglycan-associated protein
MKKFLFLNSLFFSISSFSQQSPDLKLELFFDINKYELTKAHQIQIDSAIFSRELTITGIRGFADSTGSNSYNMDLSQKRAKAVYHYFKRQPYPDSISIDFLGEQHTAGKDISYNRRVEIYFEAKMPETENTLLENSIDTLAITEKYEISNIYFIPDKAIIDPATFFAVDDAAKYLKHFPACKFEIVGHVNYAMLPTAMKNPKNLEPAQRLSEERAKAIYDLLIERGIPAESMTHKGVGNSQMAFKNPKNDEEKRKNMRVEILIACKK